MVGQIIGSGDYYDRLPCPAEGGRLLVRTEATVDICSRNNYCSRQHEHGRNVNTRSKAETTLERRCAAELERVFQGVTWLRGWSVQPAARSSDPGFDLLATVLRPQGGKAALLVQCKRDFRPSAFLNLNQQAAAWSTRHASMVRVLALPWVSPRVAELCKQAGWSWFDLAGNHVIDIPGVLRLERTGHASKQSAPRPTANLATNETGRVVRALLNPNAPHSRWTQRTIQQACSPSVSIGLVNKVVRYLLDEAFVVKSPQRGIRVSDPLRLLRAWASAAHFNQHQRVGFYSLLRPEQLSLALERVGASTQGHAAYAVFSAAERQAPHVRQPRIWLYMRAADLHRLEEEAEAKRVDSGENLVVLVPGDDGVFQGLEASATGMPCTNPVQTWADLSKSSARGEEAAEALLEQRLLPAWRKLGLIA